MNGADKKLWGYYPTSGAWVPLQVDANGKVKADLSAVNLDDLGDVNVPTPADDTFLYWDDAAGKWQSRVLAAGDIPNLDAAKITTGILAPARVGPKIQDADADTWIDVEKNADEDKIRMDVAGVEAFLLDDAGILTLAKQSSCRITQDTAQTIPTGTWTDMNFDSYDYDTQGERDLANNRIQVKAAGTYLVMAAATIYDFPADKFLGIMIRYNGNNIGQGFDSYSFVKPVMPIAFAVTNAPADALFTAEVYHNTGSDKTLSGYTGQNYLLIYKLA